MFAALALPGLASCGSAFCRFGGSAAKAAAPPRRHLGRDQGGAVALLAALTLTLMCGVVGLAIDVGVWYRTTRAMQNAADAAAVAAARDGGSSFENTGKAIAARYGFVDQNAGITVRIVNNEICPSGGANCFKATIHDNAAPQFFSQVFGVAAPALSSSATASLTAGASLHQYCILALATSGANPAVRTNGSPFADLNHCNIMSNTDMTCNGHNLNADSGDAAGTNNGCGNVENSHVPLVSDPFAYLVANIPASGSGGSAAASQSSGGSGTSWSGNKSLPATQTIVGDLTLAADTTISTPSTGSVVYIKDGTLNLNGHKLTGAAGSGLTIVFTGTNGNSTSPAPYPTGHGTLDITAPNSGPWSGVAIYIDPRTTGPQTITYAGNSPTWDITGLVYMPHANLTFSGAVNKSSTGADCFALVVDSLRINGTGSILAHGGCGTAGLSLPTNTIPGGSPALVL